MVQNDSDDRDQTNRTPNNTRRQFVAGTAGALGGLAAGAGFVAPTLAQEGDDGTGQDGEDGQGGDQPIQNEFEDDVAILNYALTLEYLEAAFYQRGLQNLAEEDFCNCGVLGEDSALGQRVYQELQTVRDHEQAHVETLSQTIESLDGEVTESPSFDFGVRVEYADVFLATAAQFEDIGVSAYAGAAPFIQNADLVPPALGIHSVEARHASFLRTVTGRSGFPNVVDEARSRSEVLSLAGEFISEESGTPYEPMDGGENGGDMPTDPGTGNETDPGTGNETDPGTGNETEPEPGTGNETEPEPGTGNETEPGTGNETG
ncbi:ferritin-like domain-containing protein [Halovenus sp. WSH3]|uniref:Ferritin-like domain-containing protein n=1 Tax=Halovenus carboxidivorans TaxID=2692199 RepID=A0A6B0T8T3_9EURY|nr:ferritin-like domain-containing protein [Halovenus carboxidivorans]